ncbi:MAG: 4-hydroxy-3-methylbut-2-en-yl diphosphate reductase [Thermotogota bacterium]|nr:4-hydroxy-3-methylbut-2-en-yl diphosphate reductase [Thermotogota bacterium]
MVEVRLGKHVGFCWGVQRVLDIVNGLLDDGEQVHVFGDLVHNTSVIEELKVKGVAFHKEDELWNAEKLEGVVVVRAHGMSPEERHYLEEISDRLVDGTCPIVSRLFKTGEAIEKEGYQICVYGNPRHPEMRAFKGYVKSAVFYPEVGDAKKVAVLAQTTADFSKFKEYAASLINTGRAEVRVINTICAETIMREMEVRKMAQECDLVIVVGGRMSSNARKLFEIAKDHVRTLWIENEEEIKGETIQGKIGIVSGTSTPIEVVRRIVDYIERGG